MKSTEAQHLSPELLKVVNSRPEGAQARPGISERHLIPYVPEIFQELDASANTVFIQPPKGLLELGRQQLLLDIIEPRIMVGANSLSVRREATDKKVDCRWSQGNCFTILPWHADILSLLDLAAYNATAL